MSVSVVIIGASGHGKVVADIIEKSGDRLVGYLDDDESLGDFFNGYPVLGKIAEYILYMQHAFVVAIGNAEIRQRVTLKSKGANWYTAVHPSAIIAKNTLVGEGTVVMAGVVINAYAVIGKHCIINSSAVIEHDNVIEDYVHISVGTKLAGTVHIGQGTWVGIGAVVSNNINICRNCMIGAGGVVVADINEPGTYIGIPAKRKA